MRRSTSCSNIPVPKSKRDSRPKERAKSSTRNSRERSLDAATPLLIHNRLLPLGKHSVQKNLLGTPSNFTPLSGTSGPYKRSTSSNFGSRISITKSPANERKKFQKLISDKKWVAEQYSKIQQFIRTSGLFDPNLAGSLRPPTIANFVELVSVLLKQIIKTGPINSSNYGDIVINNLTLFRYPGQITNSVLKMINTMHAWPHFISIISFLIDKVNCLGPVQMEFTDQEDDDFGKVQEKSFLMQESFFNFLSSTYVLTNNDGQTPVSEIMDQCVEQLKADMLRLTEVDVEAIERDKERLANEQAELDTMVNKLDENNENIAKLQKHNLEMQQTIDDYEANKGNREREVKEEVEELKKNLAYYKNRKAALKLSIKNLEDDISKQPCTAEEKIELLDKIDDLKRLIERKKLNEEKLRQQQYEMDRQLKALVAEIEGIVDTWNVAIKQTLLPELRDLKLREKGFHSPEFLEEITEIHKKYIELEKQLNNEYQENKIKIEKLEKQKASMESNNKKLSLVGKEVDDLKITLQNLEEEKQTMLSDFKMFNVNHKTKVKKAQEKREQEKKENENILKDLKNKHEKARTEMQKTKKKGVLSIIQAYNTTIQTFQQIDKKKHEMLKEAEEAAIINIEQISKLFEHLKQLQNNTAKLYATLEDDEEKNEEN